VGERKYGLIVDALEGEEELVIKALDDHTSRPIWCLAVAFRPRTRWFLILNLPAVVEHVAPSRPTTLGSVQFGLLLSQHRPQHAWR